MNCEYEDIIEYLEFKANTYAEEMKLDVSDKCKYNLVIKENLVREIISEIKNGYHLDF